jgi:hypothetical protein
VGFSQSDAVEKHLMAMSKAQRLAFFKGIHGLSVAQLRAVVRSMLAPPSSTGDGTKPEASPAPVIATGKVKLIHRSFRRAAAPTPWRWEPNPFVVPQTPHKVNSSAVFKYLFTSATPAPTPSPTPPPTPAGTNYTWSEVPHRGDEQDNPTRCDHVLVTTSALDEKSLTPVGLSLGGYKYNGEVMNQHAMYKQVRGTNMLYYAYTVGKLKVNGWMIGHTIKRQDAVLYWPSRKHVPVTKEPNQVWALDAYDGRRGYLPLYVPLKDFSSRCYDTRKCPSCRFETFGCHAACKSCTAMTYECNHCVEHCRQLNCGKHCEHEFYLSGGNRWHNCSTIVHAHQMLCTRPEYTLNCPVECRE